MRRRLRQQQLYMVNSYSSFLRRWMRLLKGCRRKGQGCYFPALFLYCWLFHHLFFIILTTNTIAIIIMTISGQSKPPSPNLSSPLWHISRPLAPPRVRPGVWPRPSGPTSTRSAPRSPTPAPTSIGPTARAAAP